LVGWNLVGVWGRDALCFCRINYFYFAIFSEIVLIDGHDSEVAEKLLKTTSATSKFFYFLYL